MEKDDTQNDKFDHFLKQALQNFTGLETISVLVSIAKGANQNFENLLKANDIKVTNNYRQINVYSLEMTSNKARILIDSKDVLFLRYVYQDRNNPERVIRAFEYVLTNKDKMGIRVVNMSFGLPEAPQNLSEFDPVKLAIKNASENGIVVVVAAGNGGPSIDTLNPFGLGRDLICVGATDEKRNLLSSSSRGSPVNIVMTPTVVSFGNDTAGTPPGYEKPPISTSFAAPRISVVATFCIRFVDKLRDCANYSPALKSDLATDKDVKVAYMDTGLNPAEESRLEIPPPNELSIQSSINYEKTYQILNELEGELKDAHISFSIESSPRVIKKMIVSMAKPLQNANKPYESGSGFVFTEEAYEYIKAFGPKSFLQIFSDFNPSSEIPDFITKIEDNYGPFLPVKDINYLHDLTFLVKAHPAYNIPLKVMDGY